MKSKPLTLAVLSAALAPGFAEAIGLGDIVLQSRVGEPLRAEVPILAAAGDTPETLCFSLGPVGSADFPVVTVAKTRVVQRGRDFRLQILGSRPIYDPIFVVALRAGCGADLRRDYVLMPEPPLMATDAPDSMQSPAPALGAGAPLAARPAARPAADWHAAPGDTLASIAEARSAARPADRGRLLAAIKRANPQFAADEPLPEGTTVRIPKLKPRQPPQPKPEIAAAPVTTESKPAPATPPQATPPAPTAAPPAATAAAASDRLLLGAAPDDGRGARGKSPQAATLSEMEEKMAQMESTLRLLRMEIDKMDAALQLADKTVEAERRLREMQNSQLAAAQSAAQNAPPPAPGGGNWLELLLSAAIGGSLAVGVASFLGRRRETAPASLLPQQFSAPPSVGETSRVDDLLETLIGTPPDNQPPVVTELKDFSDDHAVLELAEVMVSYGRLHGAAETLAEHVRERSPDNILPWSMLLDLYRRGGMREEFEALVPVIRDKFNVELPDWDSSDTPISGLRSLEEYPHIIQRIGETWGTTTGIDYLYELVHDTRAGQRHGFPLEVIEELTLLILVQEDAYALAGQRQGAGS